MKFATATALFSLLCVAPLRNVMAEDQIEPEIITPPPSGFGDPHFRTFDGTKYSFHGQCDLVMARSVSFDHGIGLELHARTHIVTDWSLIKNAALRIGKDTFELVNDGSYYYNGLKNAELVDIRMAEKYTIIKDELLVDVTNKDGDIIQEPKVFVTFDLGNNQSIKMQLWKHMISVQVGIKLLDSEGMLGVYDQKGMIGRDRETLAIDANDMGFQWQVHDTEPMLFHEMQVPQFPQQCILPSVDSRQRRLQAAAGDFLDLAQAACANVDEDIRSFCIEDVVLTQDVHVASGYGDSQGFSF